MARDLQQISVNVKRNDVTRDLCDLKRNQPPPERRSITSMPGLTLVGRFLCADHCNK
jgi:hypothetical protein